MNIGITIAIVAIHWFADFVLQTSWQAENKSKLNYALIAHTASYSFIWLMVTVGYILFLHESSIFILFPFITFIAHTITDYFTSRINARLWAEKEVHKFFVSVGFDQLLHYVQLFLTFYFLLNIKL